MLLQEVLEWVLPPVTVVLIVFTIYWYRLFTRFEFYSMWWNRPKRRRRRRPRPILPKA